MDIGVKVSAYGRALLLVVAALIFAFILKVLIFNSKETKLNQSGSINTSSPVMLVEQTRQPLAVDTVKELPISIRLVASSVQDGNAVIRQQGGKPKVISVGDEIAEGELMMKVIQVSDQQLALRVVNSNDIYLVSMSVDGFASNIQKVSSDISLSKAMPPGSPTPKKR